MNPLDPIRREKDRLWLKTGKAPKSIYIGWQDWQKLCEWYVHNHDTRPNVENYADTIMGLKAYIVENDSHHFFIV